MHHSDLQGEIKPQAIPPQPENPAHRWLDVIPRLLHLAQYHVDISFPYRGQRAADHFRVAGDLIDLAQFASVVTQIMLDRCPRMISAAAMQKCAKCEGCGKVADTEDQEPWTVWMNLPLRSSLAVLLGLVRPIPCAHCGGEGLVRS
jgi:hypothetical protein